MRMLVDRLELQNYVDVRYDVRVESNLCIFHEEYNKIPDTLHSTIHMNLGNFPPPIDLL